MRGRKHSPQRRKPPKNKSQGKQVCLRSLPLEQWPAADRQGWQDACRPGSRLKAGGPASRMSAVSQEMLWKRYSYFLQFLLSNGRLNCAAEAGAHVTPANVAPYVERLRTGVRSVTAYNSVHKLRRAAQLIAPQQDYSWLIEIEKDLAYIMQPRSKQDRVVLTEVLVEAGLTLFAEADAATHLSQVEQARLARNGLMITLLALCPIRLKNFAALELGRTFVIVKGSWWIVLPRSETKSRRPDERQVPSFLNQWIGRYLERYRPIFAGDDDPSAALWFSKRGRPASPNSIYRIVARTTQAAVGVDICPHLFRAAAASSAAIHGGDMPHLASGVLQHTDPRVTDEYYNRATTFQAAEAYALIVAGLRSGYLVQIGAGEHPKKLRTP